MQSDVISFVIPAYNDRAGLERHLDYFSLAGHPVELIVVDDASDDGTDAMIAGIRPAGHVRLRYHRNPQNQGPGAARNTGLTQATGQWLMFLDADDLLVDGFFDYIALSPLRRGADFVLFKYHLCRQPDLLFSYDMHPGDNRFFSDFNGRGFDGTLYCVAQLPSVLRLINFPWNKIYRTGFLRAAGIRFPDFRMHEDILPHWQSCLAATGFGVLNWAPPLIHHMEIEGDDRATNYVGPERLAAFETMGDVLDLLRVDPRADFLVPELLAFARDLHRWMITRAPPGLEERLTGAARMLYDRINDQPGLRAASAMGHVLPRQAP